jgi:hypothetical protein
MGARIVAIEDPCSEQDAGDPAVRVACCFVSPRLIPL